MRFLYKIWSSYDGFTPARIPDRIDAKDYLDIGWTRYVETVERRDEVWVFFHGPHAFENGVYLKGAVDTVDLEASTVRLRVFRYSTEEPLTDRDISERIAEVVAPKGRQVFLYPSDWKTAPICSLESTAESCAKHLCIHCPTWGELPLIEAKNHRRPSRLPHDHEFAPAYWVIPARCYLYWGGGDVALSVKRGSDVFYRYKLGDEILAHPLALGLKTVLERRGLGSFSAIVPIPLSPDKEAAGELHRTRLLATELGRLTDTPLVDALQLAGPISKYRLRTVGGISATRFEEAYASKLRVKPKIRRYGRVLLLDDVATNGSTLRVAVKSIRDAHPNVEVATATAGLMIVKAVVQDDTSLRAAAS